ncbi:hypothetical protein ATANTOWER_008779 [Ataeniobius toweri]|uniref:Uncharacterized protein n=1 Tax=Ataeniobius toweri TaxID=208326 RepID=A0ABU7B5U5_9TELE|nr:hypothetical protein [Ataeniobius toweri]
MTAPPSSGATRTCIQSFHSYESDPLKMMCSLERQKKKKEKQSSSSSRDDDVKRWLQRQYRLQISSSTTDREDLIQPFHAAHTSGADPVTGSCGSGCVRLS